VFYGDEPLKATGFEALVRSVGFNPMGLSAKTEQQWNERESAKAYNDAKSELYARLRNILRSPSKGAFLKWMQDAQEWNARVQSRKPMGVTPITDSSIWYVAKDLKTPPKSERQRAAGDAEIEDKPLGVTMEELMQGKKQESHSGRRLDGRPGRER
jgi:hypothetical protein